MGRQRCNAFEPVPLRVRPTAANPAVGDPCRIPMSFASRTILRRVFSAHDARSDRCNGAAAGHPRADRLGRVPARSATATTSTPSPWASRCARRTNMPRRRSTCSASAPASNSTTSMRCCREETRLERPYRRLLTPVGMCSSGDLIAQITAGPKARLDRHGRPQCSHEPRARGVREDRPVARCHIRTRAR